MSNLNEELKSWHDWTSPNFFQVSHQREERVIPLFLRQLLPVRFQKTKVTLIGWVLIVVAMGIGSAAYNTSSNILFMTLSLLLSSLVLSGILSLFNFRRLVWDLSAPKHLQVDEVGMAEVDVTNEKKVFPTIGICFQVGSSASESDERLYLKQAIPPGETIKLEWTFIPQKRGVCDVYLSGVESQFPFGFLQKVMGRAINESVLVWPARIDYTFKPGGGGQQFLSGSSKRNAGLGSDLLSIRPYQAGDPPRLVHWKATARMGKLMIRQLAQEGEAGYHMRIDTDSSVWGEDNFETLCSLICSLADELFHVGRLNGISINDESHIVIRSMRDLHDFFDMLALLERTSPKPFEQSFLRNIITFRPLGERDVALFVDENKVGQTDN